MSIEILPECLDCQLLIVSQRARAKKKTSRTSFLVNLDGGLVSIEANDLSDQLVVTDTDLCRQMA